MMNKFRCKLAWDSFKYTRQRKSGWRNCLSIAAAIFLSLVVALLVATIVGNNPFLIFKQLFTKAFLNVNQLVVNVSILGVSAIAFSFAFKAKLFNIGVTGQMLGGGITSLAICTAIANSNSSINSLPAGSLSIFMLLITMITSGSIAAIVGILKAYLKVNEVISTIMINWIIFYLVRYAINTFEYLHGKGANAPFSNSVSFAPAFAMNQIGSNTEYGWIAAIILLTLCVVTMFVVFKFTTFGLKIKAVGLNSNGAAYAGYNTKAVLVSSFTISGLFAGVLAAITFTCRQYAFIPNNVIGDILPAEGLDGIAIGLIGLTNPIAIIPVSFIMGMFQSSAPYLSVPSTFSSLITGLIMLGATMYVIFGNFKPWLWIYEKNYGHNSINSYQNYINNNETNISVAKLKLMMINKYKSRIKYLNKQLAKNEKNAVLISKINVELERLTKEVENLITSVASRYDDEKSKIDNELKKQQIISKGSQYFFPNILIKSHLKEYDRKIQNQLLKSNAKIRNKILKIENSKINNDELSTREIEKIKHLNSLINNNNNIVEIWKKEYATSYKNKIYKKCLNKQKLNNIHDVCFEKALSLKLNEVDKDNLLKWINDSYKASILLLEKETISQQNNMKGA